MHHQNTFLLGCRIDKKHLSAMTIFAVHNVPNTDQFTLHKFLELMNTTGSFGSITIEQIIAIMHWMLKNLPDTHKNSLLILIELLSAWLSPAINSESDFVITLQNRPFIPPPSQFTLP